MPSPRSQRRQDSLPAACLNDEEEEEDKEDDEELQPSSSEDEAPEKAKSRNVPSVVKQVKATPAEKPKEKSKEKPKEKKADNKGKGKAKGISGKPILPQPRKKPLPARAQPVKPNKRAAVSLLSVLRHSIA